MKESKKNKLKTATVTFTPQELEDIDLRLKNYPKVSRHEFMRWAVKVALQTAGSMDIKQLYQELDGFHRTDEGDRFKV